MLERPGTRERQKWQIKENTVSGAAVSKIEQPGGWSKDLERKTEEEACRDKKDP